MPNPRGAKSVHLKSVSCATSTFCIAVGYDGVTAGDLTLAESWNGHAWKVMKTPDRSKSFDVLTSVSCAGGHCLAVGYDAIGSTELPLSISLKGTAWTLGAPVSPAGKRATLSGLACYSATGCIAVGTYTDVDSLVLIDSWNGSKWSSMTPASSVGWLQAVTCAAPTSCLAAGVGASGLQAMSWHGTSWGASPVVQPPAPNKTETSLEGVACSSGAACVAVGVTASEPQNSMVTLAETLTGAVWRLSASPDVAGPTHVKWFSDSCVSATACFAVGQYWYNQGDGAVVYYPTYLGLVEEWNGHAWRIMPSPSLGVEQYGANGGWFITCLSSTSCVVTGGPEPLQWSGKAWSAMPVAGGSRQPRQRVFCVTSSNCYSSGSYLAQSISPAPFIDHWNGVDWSTQYPPVPANILEAGLSGIACRSATSCVGVGTYDKVAGDYGLVETRSGSHWVLGSLPYPKGDYNMNMNSISCTASACTAMASADDTQETFADRWNGSTWSVEGVPLPSVDNGGTLLGVSCPTASDCLSVGYGYNRVTFGTNPITEQWNGSKWSIDPVVYPKPDPYLGVVSCSGPSACTAVGGQIERYVA